MGPLIQYSENNAHKASCQELTKQNSLLKQYQSSKVKKVATKSQNVTPDFFFFFFSPSNY